MGAYNSSRTRVVPVFDALMSGDPSGHTWLLPMLKCGSRSSGRLSGITSATLLDGHPRWWGENERRLNPPKALLRWLVSHTLVPASEALWGSQATRQKREQLVKRDPQTISEALRLLENSCTFRKWYILEGQSQPDAFLQTDTFLVVIEGKRTEAKATTITTWMPSRSQMLRHMDAAWEIRGQKRVLGLMIVEGRGGAEAITPDNHWLNEANAQVLEETLEKSLPHRDVSERHQIADGFLGVTTWQRLCAEFGLGWPRYGDAG